MRISSWNECIETNNSLQITPDKSKAKSLLDTARARIIFADEVKIKEENANFVFELNYTSVIEMLHAIVILDGFKVENHICLGYYLLDILKNESLYRLFDDCRTKRNSLVYYGRTMDFDLAKDQIVKIKKLTNLIQEMLRKKI